MAESPEPAVIGAIGQQMRSGPLPGDGPGGSVAGVIFPGVGVLGVVSDAVLEVSAIVHGAYQIAEGVGLDAEFEVAVGGEELKARLAGDAAVVVDFIVVTLRAEVLTYSRARGLFAGISLEGSTVRPDNDANRRVYGKELDAKDIIFKGAVAVPPPAQKLVATLNQKSPKNLSDPNSLKE